MARPLTFDREQKLHEAMILFWRQGYDATSMQNLVDTLKINKFSLYNTFGDKKQLYHEALQRYMTSVVEKLLAPLEETEIPPLMRIHNYFLNLADKLRTPQSIIGCFMQNAGIETALVDSAVASMLKVMLRRIQSALQTCLDAAVHDGSLSPEKLPSDNMTEVARFLMIQAQGLLVFRKAIDCEEDMQAQIRLVITQITLWQR